eukprot:SAG22_NODE_181_length_16048_cov_157.464418_15_plen_281_part_00
MQSLEYGLNSGAGGGASLAVPRACLHAVGAMATHAAITTGRVEVRLVRQHLSVKSCPPPLKSCSPFFLVESCPPFPSSFPLSFSLASLLCRSLRPRQPHFTSGPSLCVIRHCLSAVLPLPFYLRQRLSMRSCTTHFQNRQPAVAADTAAAAAASLADGSQNAEALAVFFQLLLTKLLFDDGKSVGQTVRQGLQHTSDAYGPTAAHCHDCIQPLSACVCACLRWLAWTNYMYMVAHTYTHIHTHTHRPDLRRAGRAGGRRPARPDPLLRRALQLDDRYVQP